MLEASGLSVSRGDAFLFAGLSFRVAPGRALVVRGPNGAGKTTLLRVLCGLTRAEAGTLSWNGEPQPQALRGRVAYCGHQLSLNADLTVRQNLGFYASLQGGTPALQGLLDALRLRQCADLEVRHLSAGQRRRAALVPVLLSTAPVWVLDEPMTSLDLGAAHEVRATMRALAQQGTSLVLVTHDLADIVPEISRVVLLKQGRIAGDDTPAALLTTETLSALYDRPVTVTHRDGHFHAW